ncbi:hypothetical protein EX30DRAFT_57411 [Ascodesmis nigricans]|uniref:R3H domain-containing protein n=1 Tax=Ascodesmis nigricans TaxID=341454 RepID=A0A4S2MUZ6_9PEZI|nr:hypothetical protein EX30DRAFT_57411 [Ascodesmis nigricans]
MTAITENELAMTTTTTMPTSSTKTNDTTTPLSTSAPDVKDSSDQPLEMGKMTILVKNLSLNADNEIESDSKEEANGDGNAKSASEQNGDGVTSADSTEDSAAETPELSSSPAVVVSSQEQLGRQLPNGLPAHPADHPDPRLLDALENPRDRLFVVKLEKDIIEFINEKETEVFDLPPTNSYHRLLTHKMAEYYRLTHVADSSCAAVKIFRGQAAKIPVTKLCDWPVPSLQLQAKSNGTPGKPLVKIMRRATPSEKGGSESKGTNTPRKDGSESSSEHGDNSTTTNNPAKTTREEREAAYEKARARIFKDFVESPPETPAPTKHERSRRRDDDDFSGRSAYVPMNPAIPQPQMYFPPQYPSSMMMAQPTPQNPMRFNPMSTSFNPTSSYSPSPMGYGPPPPQQQRQYPPSGYPSDRSFSQPQQPSPQPLYPQQRGYFPQQQPSAQPGSFTPPRPPMMQQSYSSSGYSSPHTSPQPHLQHQQHPAMPGPPRQMQPQQYPPQFPSHQQQRTPGTFGWGSPTPIGGVPMHPRSSSAPGHPGMQDSMAGYTIAQQPIWNQGHGNGVWNSHGATATPARSPGHGMGVMGNGMGGAGMNMRM